MGRRQASAAARAPALSTRPAFGRYIEPFFGSGAVFFDLHRRRAAARPRRRADRLESGSDRLLRGGPRRAGRRRRRARAARRGARAPAARAHYYEVRDQRFNPQREAPARAGRPASRYTPQLAAMLIYLNRTGFNGLFRVNARGGVQRAGRPLRAAADRRPRSAARASPRRWRGPACALMLGIVRPRAATTPRRGDFVYLRSAVRAAQPDRELHQLHRAAASTPRRRRGCSSWCSTLARARLPRPAQQLDRARRSSRSTTRTTRRAAPGCGPCACRRAGRSTATPSGRGAVEEYLITNVLTAC